MSLSILRVEETSGLVLDAFSNEKLHAFDLANQTSHLYWEKRVFGCLSKKFPNRVQIFDKLNNV